jgi:hypothetical protein
MVVTLSGTLAFVDLRAKEALRVRRDEHTIVAAHTMVACLQSQEEIVCKGEGFVQAGLVVNAVKPTSSRARADSGRSTHA